MMDPNWNRGFYYGRVPPHAGMKLAREIATVTYRSGPEWEHRFGRSRADPSRPPALCPDFLIETYLDHAGEKFCLEYDANSLLYISKAMDLFDLGREHQDMMAERRKSSTRKITVEEQDPSCTLTLPEKPYVEQEEQQEQLQRATEEVYPSSPSPRSPPRDLVAGLKALSHHKVLIV